MESFAFSRAANADQAIEAAARSSTAQQGAEVRFVAGGTTLIDLMKLDVERPQQVVDINHLPLAKVESLPDGGLKIGALVRNADLAQHPIVQRDYPVLSQALLSGASAQLRNMATTGGNLLQRTRCVYFRDAYMPCNKREPGSGCSAIDGFNRTLEATVVIRGVKGERQVPIGEFFLLPGDTPQNETSMMPGDLITHVILPPPHPGVRSNYLKLRDRASYEFALASSAVLLAVERGVVNYARIALGGVGTKPWRSPEAEQTILGRPPTAENFASAASSALRNAKPQSGNAFKIELARRCLVHSLVTAADVA